MEKISYTLTQDDCKDYVLFRYKIPRIRKFICKYFIPYWVIGLIVVIGFSFPIVINLFTGLSYLMKEGEMSFFHALTDFQMCEFYLGCLNYFVRTILPFVIIWLVIFGFAWTLGATDAFSLTSKRVYKMLEGRILDAEIEILDNGLNMKGKGVASFLGWDGIVDIYETKNTFLLFISDYQAVIIPKRAFVFPEKAQEFFNYVDGKVKEAKN